MKISKRQLRRIIKEEKAKLMASHSQQPLVESMDAIKNGMAAFMEMMDGKVEAFADWLDQNPKVKEKVDHMFTAHKAPKQD